MNGKDQYIQKLLKLKDQISTASDYLILEKCTQKIQKIKAKVSDYKNKKQFLPIFDTLDLLIKEKTKYFKQKMLKNSKKIIEQSEPNRTLKYSKSAQNLNPYTLSQLKGTTTQTFYKNKPLSKKQINGEEIDEKTQITIEKKNKNKKNLEEKIVRMESQLEEYQSKVKLLETKQGNSFVKVIKEKQEEIIDDYSKKLREKSCYIEELKGKIKYLEKNNEQLRTRVLNEQRRHEDYINQLKNDIRLLKKQIEKIKKERNSLDEDNEDLSTKNEGLLNEVKRMANKLEAEIREKQQIRKNKSAKSDQIIQDLQKEIMHLSTQTSQINRLQSQLQAESQYRQQLIDKNLKVEKDYESLKGDIDKIQREKQKIEEAAERLIEENKLIQEELKNTKIAKEILGEEIIQIKQELIENMKFRQYYEHEKETTMKNKLGKLKQIKYLLNQLK